MNLATPLATQMSVFWVIMAASIGLLMAFSLYRVLKGPTKMDRVLGLNLIASKTVVLLILQGVIIQEAEFFIDIALTYALLGFAGAVIFSKFLGAKPAAVTEEAGSHG